MTTTSLAEALDIAEERAYKAKTPSFPPLDDAAKAIKKVDWADVRQRSRRGLNTCGVVIAALGEITRDFGNWLKQV